jgi:hypothetical protein
MAKTPKIKRTMGAEPALGRYSRDKRAATKAPNTKPIISGLMYWTTAARCSPMAPAISLSKHATQIPILAGFPNFCKRVANIPMRAPTTIIPHLEAKIFFMFILLHYSS